MDPKIKTAADQMERAGYLPVLRSIARSACAPFWWHGNTAEHGYRILHNGTVCFVRTPEAIFAVSAHHVYAQYAIDLKADPEVICQFGSSTIRPEQRLIAVDPLLDLVTFQVSEVQMAAIGVAPHTPIGWPTAEASSGETLLFGGFPGSLREEDIGTANMDFQWFVASPLSITRSFLKLRVDFDDFYEPLQGTEAKNRELGGMSGGPIYRFIAKPIERLELVGFITESQPTLGLVYARPTHCISAIGTLDTDAAA